MTAHYKETIWLIGDGRSGTTWVSNLINHDNSYREMFEPFHPQFISDVSFMLPHQYIRPNEMSDATKTILSKIFSGQFTHDRVDVKKADTHCSKLLIKDIFVNLLSYSASQVFPNVKIILLIRNPFAMALSKYNKRHWCWFTNPSLLLKQPDLLEDYLQPYEKLIEQVTDKNNYILNQVLIWAIINSIPLQQFKKDKLHVCFFEDICTNPNDEMDKLFSFAQGSGNRINTVIDDQVIQQPSRILGADVNLLSGNSPVDSWQAELPQELIKEGLDILQHFEMDDLYDQKSIPNKSILNKLQKKLS